MNNQGLPEVGRDLIFKIRGSIYAGVFTGTIFLTPASSREISRFSLSEVSGWVYARDAFEVVEQQKQTEQQPAQPAS